MHHCGCVEVDRRPHETHRRPPATGAPQADPCDTARTLARVRRRRGTAPGHRSACQTGCQARLREHRSPPTGAPGLGIHHRRRQGRLGPLRRDLAPITRLERMSPRSGALSGYSCRGALRRGPGTLQHEVSQVSRARVRFDCAVRADGTGGLLRDPRGRRGRAHACRAGGRVWARLVARRRPDCLFSAAARDTERLYSVAPDGSGLSPMTPPGLLAQSRVLCGRPTGRLRRFTQRTPGPARPPARSHSRGRLWSAGPGGRRQPGLRRAVVVAGRPGADLFLRGQVRSRRVRRQRRRQRPAHATAHRDRHQRGQDGALVPRRTADRLRRCRPARALQSDDDPAGRQRAAAGGRTALCSRPGVEFRRAAGVRRSDAAWQKRAPGSSRWPGAQRAASAHPAARRQRGAARLPRLVPRRAHGSSTFAAGLFSGRCTASTPTGATRTGSTGMRS